jgi:hypothetical protein
MPIRKLRTRKNEGLKKYIIDLYERPALKFLKSGEPWEPIADLIFGPHTSRPDRALMMRVKATWFELRVDILAAQKQYAPQKKPWGCRFDAR